jgi:hypothetical protein
MTMKGISGAPNCGALIMELFHSSTNAHVQHLKTRSFSAHMALGNYYKEVLERADAIAEAYQGRYGIIDYPNLPYKLESDSIMMLKGLRRYIDDNRLAMTDCSEIQNLIDEAVALIDTTLYKLEFLS